MDKKEEQFIKDAFKTGKVKESGVKLVSDVFLEGMEDGFDDDLRLTAWLLPNVTEIGKHGSIKNHEWLNKELKRLGDNSTFCEIKTKTRLVSYPGEFNNEKRVVKHEALFKIGGQKKRI